MKSLLDLAGGDLEAKSINRNADSEGHRAVTVHRETRNLPEASDLWAIFWQITWLLSNNSGEAKLRKNVLIPTLN